MLSDQIRSRSCESNLENKTKEGEFRHANRGTMKRKTYCQWSLSVLYTIFHPQPWELINHFIIIAINEEHNNKKRWTLYPSQHSHPCCSQRRGQTQQLSSDFWSCQTYLYSFVVYCLLLSTCSIFLLLFPMFLLTWEEILRLDRFIYSHDSTTTARVIVAGSGLVVAQWHGEKTDKHLSRDQDVTTISLLVVKINVLSENKICRKQNLPQFVSLLFFSFSSFVLCKSLTM